jgi:hypothetical protein
MSNINRKFEFGDTFKFNDSFYVIIKVIDNEGYVAWRENDTSPCTFLIEDEESMIKIVKLNVMK